MKPGSRRRARSMEEMAELQSLFGMRESAADSIAQFRPGPTDVVISPYGKCGTTWLQQMFHCLRTHGDMDFDDISRVVPWIETAKTLGIDLDAPQRGEPRGFKSHLPYAAVPKGARYIVPLRDPRDALVSMYRFMEGWFLEPGAVSIEDFGASWLERGGGQDFWSHLVGWWEQRDNPDVLLLSYEQMSANRAETVRRVAQFCRLPLNDKLLTLTLDRTSFAYMLAHKDRFDDLMMREASERMCGLPPGSDSAKVRRGAVGAHSDELPAGLSSALDRKWAEVVAPATGFDSYSALEQRLEEF